MKLAIICALCAAFIGTPCLYDATSREPSPLAGGLAAAFGDLPPPFTSDALVNEK